MEKQVFGNPGKYKLVVNKSSRLGDILKNNSGNNSGYDTPDSMSSACSLISLTDELDDGLGTFQAARARDSIQLSFNNVQKFVPRILPPRISITVENIEEETPDSPTPVNRFKDSLEGLNLIDGRRESWNSGHLEVPIPEPKPVRIPVITEEMLEKHSLHYLLMHNFFMSDSSLDSSPCNTPTPPVGPKRVRFNLEPIEIEDNTPVSEYAFIEAGALFQTRWETIERHEHTLLGSQEKWQYFDSEKQRFIFEIIKWNPYDQEEYPGVPDEPVYIKAECFESVLFYYQDIQNTLRCPIGIKHETFLDTLRFFKINPKEITVGPYEQEIKDDFEGLVPEDPKSFQSAIFLCLYHKTSAVTKIYTVFDVIFILVSVVSCISATLPDNRPPNLDPLEMAFFARYGAIRIFVWMDAACMIWFSILFLLHFFAAPQKIKFLASFQTGIDLMLIATFCMLLAVANSDASDNKFLKNIIRLSFSFRILRLSRHSLLLNSLGTALKDASRELLSVCLFLFVIVFLFACLEYLAEVKEPEPPAATNGTDCITEPCPEEEEFHSEEYHHEDDVHYSILEYVWWSLITITTIGYGSPAILTTAGKIIGGFCAIAGVPLFAIPIPILSKHLDRSIQREQRKNEYMRERMSSLSRGDKKEGSSGEENSDEGEDMSWKKIVGERRKSMGPQFAMTHFRP